MRLSPSHWYPAPWPPLLWPLSPELSAESWVRYGRMLDTVLTPDARLLSPACTLETQSHRRGCFLNQTHSQTETHRPHLGLSPGAGPLLQWPSSNSRTGEITVYLFATSTRKSYIGCLHQQRKDQTLLIVIVCTKLSQIKRSDLQRVPWLCPSRLISVLLSGCHGVGVAVWAQPLLLSNWISIWKPGWTHRRAKWGTTHLRITFCNTWLQSTHVLSVSLLSEAPT